MPAGFGRRHPNNCDLQDVKLRDLFACFVVAGLLSDPHYEGEVASHAYQLADELLAAADDEEPAP